MTDRKVSGVNVTFLWAPLGDDAHSPASFGLMCRWGKRPKLAGGPLFCQRFTFGVLNKPAHLRDNALGISPSFCQLSPVAVCPMREKNTHGDDCCDGIYVR
jgi:hypothetical protein